MLATFDGVSTFLPHQAWLISPPIPSTTHCLRARVYVETALEITYEYSVNGMAKRDMVLAIRSSLGRSFHDIAVQFEAGDADGGTGRLVVGTTTEREPGVIAAAMTHVRVDPDSCLATSKSRLDNCLANQLYLVISVELLFA